MAFATNASAFGMSSNTPANTSLFGATKPQGGSIFGAPQQQQQPSAGQTQTPSLFGGTQQQQPAGSLFGQPAQQQQQQAVGSLFGQPSQQQQPTGGLFGQSAGQQQQQPSGSLFGQPAAQQQQQPTGGLFGQSTQQQQPSLFGQSTQQQQPAVGHFGQSIQQQPQQQQGAFGGGSPFGSTLGSSMQQQPQQQQQQQAGLFGSTLAAPNPLQAQPTIPAGGFGGGFGATSIFKPQPQPTPGLSTTNQPPSAPLFTKSTKFNDLPDELKRILENLDSHIQERIQISKDLHQRKLGDEPLKGQELIRSLHKDYVNVSTMIRHDLRFTTDIKTKVEQAVRDTIIATRIVDGFKNPGGGSYLKDHAGFPLEFFSRVTEQMKERLAWYKSTIEQIERKLSSSANQGQTPQGISATLQAQHATFITLASKTAALDSELQTIKTLYTQLWRAKTGSVRDPFNELDRMLEDGGDYGLGGMNVK